MAQAHRYAPTPIQYAFHTSPARIRGYGGAMGGGKSRAICEEALRYAVEWPGCPIVIARQSHTSIKETTKKTMLEEVIPPKWVRDKKASMGEDWIRLHNGSIIHFIGLDDPVRWYSAQLGVLIVDQVEECDEDTIVKLMTRLRHPAAPVGVFNGQDIAGKVILSFNPANPGHWLQEWFIMGAAQSVFGFRRDELFTTDANAPIGDAEFFFAKATDNPYLAAGYVDQTLAALPAHLRRRYLDGIWEFITGTCYFDTDALTHYQETVRPPEFVGDTTGDVTGKNPADRVRVRQGRNGSLSVWKPPVRERLGEEGRKLPAHRYVISVDVSSGGSSDYSGVQVISVEDFEQVAELQIKLDPDLLAVEVFRLGCIYNGALVAIETTGGWGYSAIRSFERLASRYRGVSKPRLYTRRVEDRVAKRWTDKLGWDTNTRSRPVMLDTLEEVLREKSFVLNGQRTLAELGTFVRDEKGRPAAQSGCHDDLVVSLAIGVTLASTMPRQLRRLKPDRYQPQFVTGY